MRKNHTPWYEKIYLFSYVDFICEQRDHTSVSFVFQHKWWCNPRRFGSNFRHSLHILKCNVSRPVSCCIFIALSHPTRGRPSCFAHTTRAQAPPIPAGWGGLIYGIRWRNSYALIKSISGCIKYVYAYAILRGLGLVYDLNRLLGA